MIFGGVMLVVGRVVVFVLFVVMIVLIWDFGVVVN